MSYIQVYLNKMCGGQTLFIPVKHLLPFLFLIHYSLIWQRFLFKYVHFDLHDFASLYWDKEHSSLFIAKALEVSHLWFSSQVRVTSWFQQVLLLCAELIKGESERNKCHCAPRVPLISKSQVISDNLIVSGLILLNHAELQMSSVLSIEPNERCYIFQFLIYIWKILL